MPRGNQAKMAESKKRTASTKSVSDEELSPKRAKALKDANKTGILDKCVFCTKSGVRTMLEGAGTATNMRFFLMFLIYGSKITVLFKRFHLAAEHYFPEGKFKDVAPPSADDLEPGKLLPNNLMGKVYKYSCHFQVKQGSIFTNLEKLHTRALFIPQPCTKRKQGYKELVLHLATQHQLLKEVLCPFGGMLIRFLILSLKYSPAHLWLKHFPGQVMSKDKRPGVAALFEDKEQVNWNIPSFI